MMSNSRAASKRWKAEVAPLSRGCGEVARPVTLNAPQVLLDVSMLFVTAHCVLLQREAHWKAVELQNVYACQMENDIYSILGPLSCDGCMHLPIYLSIRGSAVRKA